jgi:hypothetical protein
MSSPPTDDAPKLSAAEKEQRWDQAGRSERDKHCGDPFGPSPSPPIGLQILHDILGEALGITRTGVPCDRDLIAIRDRRSRFWVPLRSDDKRFRVPYANVRNKELGTAIRDLFKKPAAKGL